MTRAIDTSVAVAAFAPWHEAHEAALRVLEEPCSLPAQCGVETYSTLTRLPSPFRSPAAVVSEYLHRRFGPRWLFPPPETVIGLPSLLSDLELMGGAAYDAIVAVTARDCDAQLWTLDRKAERTYRLVGVTFSFAR